MCFSNELTLTICTKQLRVRGVSSSGFAYTIRIRHGYENSVQFTSRRFYMTNELPLRGSLRVHKYSLQSGCIIIDIRSNKLKVICINTDIGLFRR